jgi:hypothetical protein
VNPTQKEYNRISKAKAESIRSERELQFINQNFDFADRLNAINLAMVSNPVVRS